MGDEIGENVGPDFSTLPDNAWVRILQYLSHTDRARVAKTCSLLYGIFSHPSLWGEQTLTFLGQDHCEGRFEAVFVSKHFMEITKRYGKYFKHLTINVHGHLRKMSEEIEEVLAEVAEHCRLESLTLNVGVQTSGYHVTYGFGPNRDSFSILASFIRNAFKIKRLNIFSWPMFENVLATDECNVFKALEENDKLKQNLEALTLFWTDGVDWSERMPLLLSPTETLTLINKFKNLTTIGLRSPMLSDELLVHLASPHLPKFECLKVIVHYLNKPKYQIPRIEPSTWRALVKRNPEFRVEVSVFLSTPNLELVSLLTPEVPVSKFSYTKYARCDLATIAKLYSQYNTTLQEFMCFYDSEHIDEELIKLCEKCECLTNFVFLGKIKIGTVKKLAKLRGESWNRFEVKADLIKIETEFDNIDEDQVLYTNERGDLVQVALNRFHAEDGEQIQTMVTEVSACLGRPWKPTGHRR